ncbi:MAG: hypothetical protein GXO73_02055, partial [Calditrichaeota bacterium]|nr:hypothetical protein [Calditrichota bacterium]
MPDSDDNLDFLKDVLDDYLVETGELVEQLESDLVALESRPTDADLLNQIFRAVHTIKGTSSFLGFERMSELTHRAEDVLNLLRHGEMAVDARVMDVLLQVVDWIRRLLEHIRQEANDGDEDLSGILQALEGLLKGDEAQEKVAGSVSETRAADQESAEKAEAASPEERDANQTATAEETKLSKKVEVDSDEEPAAAEKGETKTTAKDPASSVAEAPAKAERPPVGRREDKGPQTVRVPVERLDEIMDLVGEL